MEVICVDFDGVVHNYTSGFTRDEDINDGIVEGAKDAIERLRRKYKVFIFSTRARSVAGKNAMISFLAKEGVEVDGITAVKIPAKWYIDDRGLKFEGDWAETLREVESAMTWQELQALSGKLMQPTDEVDLTHLFDRQRG